MIVVGVQPSFEFYKKSYITPWIVGMFSAHFCVMWLMDLEDEETLVDHLLDLAEGMVIVIVISLYLKSRSQKDEE